MTKQKLPAIFDRTALSPLFDNSIGFDRLFDHIFDDFLPAANSVSYPPYNIRKVDENDRLIEIALAGYSEADLDVSVKNNLLTVAGEKAESEDPTMWENYIHRGVAARKFKRQFQLADNAEVASATYENGMLNILIQLNQVDEATKRIEIKSGG